MKSCFRFDFEANYKCGCRKRMKERIMKNEVRGQQRGRKASII